MNTGFSRFRRRLNVAETKLVDSINQSRLQIPNDQMDGWKNSSVRKICFDDARKTAAIPAKLHAGIAAILKGTKKRFSPQIFRLGYPRAILKPSVQKLLDANRSMCQVEAGHIVPIKHDQPLQIVNPDLLPRKIVEYGHAEAMAFIASQLPFLYAPLRRVLEEVSLRIPSFQPQSILDFGCGAGSGLWAANELWSGSLKRAIGVDISEPMLSLAKKLWEGSAQVPLESCEFRRFLPMMGQSRKYDLVIASVVLSDLPDEGVRNISLDALWEQTGDILVRKSIIDCQILKILIDRGCPEGSKMIADARRRILQKAGYLDEDGNTVEAKNDALHIVAPCPHEKRCPMLGSWCHFSQRLQLNNFQMETYHMKKGFEDQKYSYLVLRKSPRPSDEQSFSWPRLIRRPLKRSGHMHLDYCDADGTFKRTAVTRCQGKARFLDARKSKWGDLWPHALKNPPRILPTLYVKPDRKRQIPTSIQPIKRGGDDNRRKVDSDWDDLDE